MSLAIFCGGINASGDCRSAAFEARGNVHNHTIKLCLVIKLLQLLRVASRGQWDACATETTASGYGGDRGGWRRRRVYDGRGDGARSSEEGTSRNRGLDRVVGYFRHQ